MKISCMKLSPLVSQGIHFSCTGCGHCCSASQEGLILVYWEDIHNLQKALNLPLNIIGHNYMRITDYEYSIWNKRLANTGKKITLKTLVLNSKNEENCIFLKKNESNKNYCTIYQYRPIQCRLYPFWDMIMTSDFEYHMHQLSCPGLSTKEKSTFYTAHKMMKQVEIERKMEYDYIQKMKHCHNNIYAVYPFLNPKTNQD